MPMAGVTHASHPPGFGTHNNHAPNAALVQKRQPCAYVITGVSGSGKSTIGKVLADRLQCPFYDGDDYHPQTNIAKMQSGQALTDTDREPWLLRLACLLEDHVKEHSLCVLACSCLKMKYRKVLSGSQQGASHADAIAFVLLQPSKEELQRRVNERAKLGGHFMPASLLDSQLAALEIDPDSQVYGAMASSDIVDAIVAARHTGNGH